MSRRRTAIVSAAVAAGAVAGGLVGRAAIRRRRDRAHPPVGDLPPEELEPIVSFDGTSLSARAAGNRSAPTIVLSHGFSLDSTIWGAVWPELAREFRVVTFDHRSHGRSDAAVGGDLSIGAIGRDLVAVLERVAPQGPAIVVGHSMGGMAILAAAEQRPDAFAPGPIAGAVFVGVAAANLFRGAMGSVTELLRPRLGSFAAAARRVDLLRRAILASPGDLSGIVTRVTQFGHDASPHLVEHVVDLAASARPEVWTDGLPELMELDLRHATSRVRVPALVLVGDQDRVTPPAVAVELAGALPDGRLTFVEGAGHIAMLERPADVVREITSFARSLTTIQPRASRKRRRP
jgi:pimeloyl-ACP methyl ester carboxylesterase